MTTGLSVFNRTKWRATLTVCRGHVFYSAAELPSSQVQRFCPSFLSTSQWQSDIEQAPLDNRKWTKRDGGTGDVFRYDPADQANAVKLNVANPDTTPTPTQSIWYDANGNRTTFSPYGTTDTYTTNYLNQYTRRNGINAQYDKNGNLTTGFDGFIYQYDAQNRSLTAQGMSFKYDGLNRQVSRTVNGGTQTFSVWDGWNLVQEYHMSNNTAVVDASYLYGATGLVKNLTANRYYYQDASGSTSHLANSGGSLLEWYRYDLQGTPFVNGDPNNHTSAYGVRHLFTGQQWYKDIGLYDLRNRFYSPDIGRFLQPDPIGFRGDRTNLYRYCRNNPVTRWDPFGLTGGTPPNPSEGERVTVFGPEVPPDPGDISDTGFLPGSFGWPTPLDPERVALIIDHGEKGGLEVILRQNQSPSVQHSLPSNVPSQDPANDILAGAEVSLDAAGTTVGVGENVLSGGGGEWLSLNRTSGNLKYYGMEFRGNQHVTGYRSVTRGIRLLRGAGLAFYGAQIGIAATDLYHNPSSANFAHQGLNLGVGALAFTGVPGFATATLYFIIEDTIGWDELISGYKPSPILVVPDYF